MARLWGLGLGCVLGPVLALSGCRDVDKTSGPIADDRAGVTPDLAYKFTPIFNDGAIDGRVKAIKVELMFAGDADGQTHVLLGRKWADERAPWVRFKDISVRDQTTTYSVKSTKDGLTLQHNAGENIVLSYSLLRADTRDPSQDIEYFYAPVFQDDLIHMTAPTSLALPVIDGMKTYTVSAKWDGIPKTWETADTLRQRPLYGDEVMQQVFVAGDADHFTRAGAANDITIIKSDAHTFGSDEFTKVMVDGVGALNRMWGDTETRFLMSLLGVPETANYTSFSGTGRFDSFISAATQDVSLDKISLFLIHEITHNWMPAALGVQSSVCGVKKCENTTRWFTEGFTDFVATRAMLDSGYWQQADLVRFSNQYLRDYYVSPARGAGVQAIEREFWTDYEHERQPYWRGFIFGMNWNQEIKVMSDGNSSLMDVLRDMRDTAVTLGPEDKPQLNTDYIAQAFLTHVGLDIKDDLQTYYIKGGILTPRADWFEGCAELNTRAMFTYDVSFDPEVTLGTGIVSGVVTGSNAYKAGLRDGQTLIAKVSGGGGDTTQPIVLKVRDDEGGLDAEQAEDRNISYLPISGAAIDVPQFEINGQCQ